MVARLLPGPQPEPIEVTTPRRVRSLPGLRVLGRRSPHRIRHRTLPTVTPAQAILDLAAGHVTRRRLQFVLANADYAQRLDVDEIRRLTGRGVAGSAGLGRALAAHLPELAETRSRAERALLHLCRAHGLPLPRINTPLHGHLVDAVWPEARVVVEVDGYGNHRSRAQLRRDHRRDLELRAAGFATLRYTEDQLEMTPELGGRRHRPRARELRLVELAAELRPQPQHRLGVQL